MLFLCPDQLLDDDENHDRKYRETDHRTQENTPSKGDAAKAPCRGFPCSVRDQRVEKRHEDIIDKGFHHIIDSLAHDKSDSY